MAQIKQDPTLFEFYVYSSLYKHKHMPVVTLNKLYNRAIQNQMHTK